MSALMSINFWCFSLTRIINYDKFLFDWVPKIRASGGVRIVNLHVFPRAVELWKPACQRGNINVTTGHIILCPPTRVRGQALASFKERQFRFKELTKEVPGCQMVKNELFFFHWKQWKFFNIERGELTPLSCVCANTGTLCRPSKRAGFCLLSWHWHE